MENIIEVILRVEANSRLSEFMNRVKKELEGKYDEEKDILKLRDFSRKGNQIHLVYEVLKGKEFSSPIKEVGGWKGLK